MLFKYVNILKYIILWEFVCARVYVCARVCVGLYHLSYSMKALAMELERLLKQHLVLHRPLIGERCEVGEVKNGTLEVVFVPEQHAKCLLAVVAVLVFGKHYVVFHCKTMSNQ